MVLLYEHGNRSGAKGVILSQPLGPTDPRFEPAAAPGGLPALSHFLGGPVGMPGDKLSCPSHHIHGCYVTLSYAPDHFLLFRERKLQELSSSACNFFSLTAS